MYFMCPGGFGRCWKAPGGSICRILRVWKALGDSMCGTLRVWKLKTSIKNSHLLDLRVREVLLLTNLRILCVLEALGGAERLREGQFAVFYVSGRFWEAQCVVFYVPGRLWEAKCVVFYVSGRLKRR